MLLPILAALALWAIPAAIGDRLAAAYGSVISGLVLVGSVVLWPQTEGWMGDGSPDGQPLRAVTDVPWIPSLGVRFHVGVDSISMPLIVLTALLTFLCCLYSLKITPRIGRTRSLIALLLVIEAGVLGTFSAMDLVLFFVSFEIVLIPMWLVIDIWGDEHDPAGRKRAATTFILMTVLGSALMLIGFLLVYRQAGTFDIVQLSNTRCSAATAYRLRRRC